MAGQLGGSGAQGICYNEDGLPAEYRGNLFFCDWGLQAVFRFEIRKAGGTFAVTRRTAARHEGGRRRLPPVLAGRRPPTGSGFWLVDWAYNGWLAEGAEDRAALPARRTTGPIAQVPSPRPEWLGPATRLAALDHPALSVRLESQRVLARQGSDAVPDLVARLKKEKPETGRLHALWALDAIGTPEARSAIRECLGDAVRAGPAPGCRSCGIRGDREALGGVCRLLRRSRCGRPARGGHRARQARRCSGVGP